MKAIRKNDILLLAALLAAGGLLWLVLSFTMGQGAQVDIIVGGKVVESYPLGENRSVELGYNGHNLLVIEGGRASMAEADCPDRLCVKQRSISRDGETIVCLPHKLVARVSGGEKSDIDGVAQ